MPFGGSEQDGRQKAPNESGTTYSAFVNRASQRAAGRSRGRTASVLSSLSAGGGASNPAYEATAEQSAAVDGLYDEMAGPHVIETDTNI